MTKGYWTRIIIVVFIVASLGFSASTLFHQSLRLDESQSLWVSTKSVWAIIQYLSLDVHVPLYELILHFWLQIFGVSIIAARSLSFLFFIASLPMLYLVAKKASNTSIALLTITLYSLSPFILWYSFEARMYTMFTLITIVSHYYFLKLIRTNGQKGQVGYFFATLFGLYTHYFFVLLIISQCIFLAVYHRQRYMEQKKSVLLAQYPYILKKGIIAFIPPLLLSILLFLPWAIYFILQGAAGNTQPEIPPSTVYDLFQAVVNFLFGFSPLTIQSMLVALWPLCIIPIFFLFSKRSAPTKIHNMLYFVSVTILPVVICFLVSYYKPIFLARYLIFITPSFFFLLSWMLFQTSKQLSTLVISIFAFIMFSFVVIQNISNSTPVKENYEGVVRYLNTHVTPSDIVAISTPFTIYPIEYYYTGSATIVTIPLWDVYKSGSIPPYTTAKLATQMKSYASVYQDIYVVLSYDQGYEASIKKYLDTHYQRKLLKEFSPGLELREYKLLYE